MLSDPVRILIDQVLARSTRGATAVFDADGTLWRGDVGEELLQFLEADGTLPKGTWAEYQRRHHKDRIDAYGFNATALAGLTEAQVREKCAALFEKYFARQIFDFVPLLLEQLNQREIAVWVVSASPRWAVEPGARQLGIEVKHIIAVETEVKNGTLTSQLIEPIPAGDGKVAQLRRAGVTPLLGAGNGDLDQPMLEHAQHAFVVAPQGAQNALVQHARRVGWPLQLY